MADIFDQVADKKPRLAKQVAATRSSSSSGDVFDQVARPQPQAAAPQPQGMPLAPTLWGQAKQAYEGTLPILDYTRANQAALGSLARGVVGGVKSGYNTLREALRAWNDPQAEVGDTVLPRPQVEQVPGAIRDINASADPLGTYAKAAQETASQGAGAALTALGTEGLSRGVSAVSDVPVGRLAKAVGGGVKGAAGKVPILGPVARGAYHGALESWRGSAPPEAPINPALTTPSRTLPGMNPPEVVRPTSQPIPPRSGLMLPAAPEPGSLVRAVTEQGPAPVDDFVTRMQRQEAAKGIGQQPEKPEGMSPNEVALWQQGAFNEAPPADIGSQVRASMPSVPRGGVTPQGQQLLGRMGTLADQIKAQESIPAPEEDLTPELQRSLDPEYLNQLLARRKQMGW